MSFSHYGITIEGERVRLKVLTTEDASEEYAGWLNDPEVNKHLETKGTTLSELTKYIQEKLESDNAIFFGIYWKGNDKHIGTVKLEPIDMEHGRATMGILIGDKEYWGRGIAVEVTNMMVYFVFGTLELPEINLGVRPDNAPAIRVYEKCGFTIFAEEENQIHMLKKQEIYECGCC